MRIGRWCILLFWWSIFLLFFGAYFSKYFLHFAKNILFVVSVLPWWYWSLVVIVLSILRLWWSDWWFLFYAEKIKPYQKKISQVTAGWGFWVISNWWIDNPMYLLVIAYEGLIMGGIIMAVFITFWNSAYVLFNEHSKRQGVDWLGFDGIDSIHQSLERQLLQWKSYRSHSVKRFLLFIPKSFVQLAMWMLNKGDGFAFIALTIWTDSFVTLAYIRRGQTGRITGNHWGLFLLSTILSNAYWSIRSFGIIVMISYFVHIFN